MSGSQLLRRRARFLLPVAVAMIVAAGPAPAALGAHSVPAPASPAPTVPTGVPHYFGPYPNWANSPQVLANAVVTISGGGGAGAEATATVAPATGAITAITVTRPGSGYSFAPDVSITAAGVTVTPASATAIISGGAVTAITVTAPGAGYLTPGLKKFVDTLPGLGADKANDLGQYIPVAVPDTTTYPGTDYYEIARRPVPA